MGYLGKPSEINDAEPQVMHIDLNSAFATIEQQANPLLRGKPVLVCSYTTPGGIVLAPSYEAKARGVRTVMPVRNALQLCPDAVLRMPDPHRCFYFNARLYALLRRYTNNVTPLSIDEFAIDFTHSRLVNTRSLRSIALEIKRRIRFEVGDWLRVNIGLGTNRFLAKTAASLHKPNGLDIITARNLRDVYGSLSLMDLTGINRGYSARLLGAGIFTPLEFLDAPVEQLHKEVFQSIEGYRWHQRLRGWEVDGVSFGRHSFSSDFAIRGSTDDDRRLGSLIMQLSEKAGRLMRDKGYQAEGAQISLLFDDGTFWHTSRRGKSTLYSLQDVYRAVLRLYNSRPSRQPVSHIGVGVYGLSKVVFDQLQLFDTPAAKQRRLALAMDAVNNRWGEFTVKPGIMLNMVDQVLERVSFGIVKHLEPIYQAILKEYPPERISYKLTSDAK